MKSILTALTILLALMVSSCAHMYSTKSSGKDNVSHVIVLTEGIRYDNVSVEIDGVQHPYGKVCKIKNKRKAENVTMEPGQHHIKVLVDGKVITDENVFIGLQETKMIVLK